MNGEKIHSFRETLRAASDPKLRAKFDIGLYWNLCDEALFHLETQDDRIAALENEATNWKETAQSLADENKRLQAIVDGRRGAEGREAMNDDDPEANIDIAEAKRRIDNQRRSIQRYQDDVAALENERAQCYATMDDLKADKERLQAIVDGCPEPHEEDENGRQWANDLRQVYADHYYSHIAPAQTKGEKL